ncbi:MAG: alpha/beta hydrolase [Sulfuricella sp.]|nr:lysophospholipase [Gammaproteobacteria bacterium]
MPLRRRLAWLGVLALLTGGGGMAEVMAAGPDLEISVCGAMREPLAFWLFRRVAGAAGARRLAGIPNIERLAFKTRDGRELGGYKLISRKPRGYLLVAPGNAMLAGQIMGELQYFRDLGYDVYVYDYRGYGLSGGASRLMAIVSDYREIVTHLNTLGYPRSLLYGMSMGGVILLNAVGAAGQYHAMVVDSTPSRISPLGCPASYDPVGHLPADCSRIKIIAGERDLVVPPGEAQELLDAAQHCGATLLRQRDFAHPFQDASAEIHRRRFEAVADFLGR